jgi:hypothetical protein
MHIRRVIATAAVTLTAAAALTVAPAQAATPGYTCASLDITISKIFGVNCKAYGGAPTTGEVRGNFGFGTTPGDVLYNCPIVDADIYPQVTGIAC